MGTQLNGSNGGLLLGSRATSKARTTSDSCKSKDRAFGPARTEADAHKPMRLMTLWCRDTPSKLVVASGACSRRSSTRLQESSQEIDTVSNSGHGLRPRPSTAPRPRIPRSSLRRHAVLVLSKLSSALEACLALATRLGSCRSPTRPRSSPTRTHARSGGCTAARGRPLNSPGTTRLSRRGTKGWFRSRGS